jgi:uncharacterized protein (DUF3820 family)
MNYTDETLMPFGRWKNTKLANVSPNYLLWIYDNIPNLHEGFKKYIDDNRQLLNIEALAQKQKAKAQNQLNLR